MGETDSSSSSGSTGSAPLTGASPAVPVPRQVVNNNVDSPSQSSSSSSTATSAVILGRNTLSPLPIPKILTSTDVNTFIHWKNAFTGYCLSQSILEVVETDATTLLSKAIRVNPVGRSLSTLGELYLTLHSQVVGVLFQATEGVIARTIFDTLEERVIVTNGLSVPLKYNANDYWKKLCAAYERKTVFSLTSIWNELLHLKYKEGTNPMELRKKFDSLMMQMQQVDSSTNLSNESKAAILIGTLPHSMDATVQNIMANPKISQEVVWESLLRRFDINGGASKHSKSASPISESANSLTDDPPDQKKKKKKQHQPRRNGEDKPKGAGPLAWCLFSSPLDGLSDSSDEQDLDGYSSDDYLPEEQLNAALEDGTYENRRREFILDSGCTKHMVYDRTLLKNVKKIEPIRLTCAFNKPVVVNEAGSVKLSSRVELHDVVSVPAAGANLIGLSKIVDSGCNILFTKHKAYVFDSKHRIDLKKIEPAFVFPRVGSLYIYTQFSHNTTQADDRPSFELKAPAPGQIPKYSDRKKSEIHSKFTSESTSARKQLNDARRRNQPTSTGKALGTESAKLLLSNSFNPLLALSSESSTTLPDSTSLNSSTISSSPKERITDTKVNKAMLWHARLAHQANSTLIGANNRFKLGLTQVDIQHLSECICDACVSGKSRRAKISSNKDSALKAGQILDCLHMDLIGPLSSNVGNGKERLPSLGGNVYGLVIVDEYSRAAIVGLIPLKSETTSRVIQVIKQLQTSTGKKVKRIHSDGGGEFINHELQHYLNNNGITHTYTPADTPQLNGIAERMNQTLLNMIRSMLVHAHAPPSFWGEAILWAAFIHNCTPQAKIGMETPFMRLFGHSPNLNKLKVFGCDAYVHIKNIDRGKVDAKFRKGIFIGYCTKRHSYRIIDPVTHTITVSRDVKFAETKFTQIALWSKPQASHLEQSSDPVYVPTLVPESIPDSSVTTISTSISTHSQSVPTVVELDTASPSTEDENNSSSAEVEPDSPSLSSNTEELEHKYDIGSDTISTSNPVSEYTPSVNPIVSSFSSPTSDVIVTQLPPTVRTRSSRIIRPVSRYGLVSDGDIGRTANHRMLLAEATAEGHSEPITFNQAMKSEQSVQWKNAMQEELKSLAANRVWSLVKKPNGIKPITGRWVFKIKLDSNNQPVRYKARYVAKGFQQTHGIDYYETFAPVAKLKSIKMVLSLAAQFNLELKQLDFDTAFLNATLSEDVYIEQPTGFTNGDPTMVCKLNKALYGLKQAPHEWNSDLHKFLLHLGYVSIQSDTCIYLKKHGSRIIILCLYVDDTIVAYNKQDEHIWLADKSKLGTKYKIKDIGDCEWILNMKVSRDRVRHSITLCQEAYVKRVLKQFNMEQCKSTANPESASDLTFPIDNTDAVALSPARHSLYRSIVGALLYASNTTRVDIAHIVSLLSRYVANPAEHHLLAAQRVLRYLSGTTDLALVFNRCTDSNLKLEIYTDASWGNDRADRKSTTGTVVRFNGNLISWLSKKQEATAISSTEAEYYALSTATQEALWYRTWISEVFDRDITVTIYSDNQSAIAISKNDTIHSRSKHIDIRYHFIRDHIKQKHIVVTWISTKSQQADLLTKMLTTSQFQQLRSELLAKALV